VRKLVAIVIVIAIIIGGVFWWRNSHADTLSTQSKPATASKPTTPPAHPADTFNKTRYSLTDPNSLWVIVNKQHPLNPVTYTPSDLRTPDVTLRVPGAPEMQLRDVAATAVEQLFNGAATAGYSLQVSTAYRGYAYQKTLYDGYVASDGQAAADKGSARPGYSEHQTGLAVDVRNTANTCALEACFGTTPEGEWLAANAWRYGFLLRYPADKETVTGYEYEPWHFRYIGKDLATELHKDHIETLEEFFDVSGGTTYR